MGSKRLLPVTIILAFALVSCSGDRATLRVQEPDVSSGKVTVGHTITFGGGPLTAEGGPVTIADDLVWSEAAGVGSLGLWLMSPAENMGQEPGITVDEPKQFQTLHEGRGLVLSPGERWFFVISAVGRSPGRWSMGLVSLTYRAGKNKRQVTVTIPTKMTVEVTKA